MQVQTNSIQYLYAQMQALMAAGASATSGGDAAAGQDVPGGSADSTGGVTAPTPAQPAAGTPASQFSSDILSSLISLQQVQQPSISSVSQAVISSLDSNGDGALNLSEFETALGGTLGGTAGGTAGGTSSTTGTGATSAGAGATASGKSDSTLASIFAQLDTNGDGELDPTELTKAVQDAVNQAEQAGGGRHHHGHHHHLQSADSTTTTTTDPLTSTSASSTSSTTTTASTPSTDTTGTGTTASLAAAILA